MWLGSFVAGGESGSVTPVKQTLCPVMEGRRVSRRLYVDYEGERIYVCCVPCVKALKKNPAKFRDRLRSEGVVLEKVPIK
jgi:hypothetical protein